MWCLGEARTCNLLISSGSSQRMGASLNALWSGCCASRGLLFLSSDADGVAGRVAERAVTRPPGLIGRLLQDFGA